MISLIIKNVSLYIDRVKNVTDSFLCFSLSLYNQRNVNNLKKPLREKKMKYK